MTLHVGAGTFLPVKAEDTRTTRCMRSGARSTPRRPRALNAARARGGRIVCVGTTSLRMLESAADGQGRIQPFAGETSIFITPGYRFRAVDVLMTNFHLPRSTLFMLVARLLRPRDDEAAYAHAIAAGYRFYSYGDACLLIGGSAQSGRVMSEGFSFAVARTRRRGAPRRDRHAARRHPHAGLHAGRHGGDGQGDAARGGARRSAPTSCSPTPIT